MVITVGFFDGVHMGHRRVLRALLERGERAAAVTFWPHPRAVLQQDARDLKLLSSYEEKLSEIRSAGVRDVRCIDFTREFASATAEQFIKECLIDKMGCDCLVLGYDNRLGSDGLSTGEVADLCRRMGLEVVVVPPYEVDDVCVSSTCIRRALTDGDVALSARMLGQRYRIKGIVVPGNRLGRTIGFPTANIDLSFPLKVIPKNGVYATEVSVNGKQYRGMTNIGVRPTLGSGGTRLIETNIFDFDEDIYGLEIELGFIARVRDEKRFDSLEELGKQLRIDRHHCFGYN